MDISSIVNIFWAVVSACSIGGFVIYKYTLERSDHSRIRKIEIIEGMLSTFSPKLDIKANDSATENRESNFLGLNQISLRTLLAETQISAAYGTSISLEELRTLLLADSPDKALTEYSYSNRFLKIEKGNIYRKYEFKNDERSVRGIVFSLTKYIHQLMGTFFFLLSIVINFSILSVFDSIVWNHPLSEQLFSLTFCLGAIPMSLLFIYFGTVFFSISMKYPATKFLKEVFGDLFVDTNLRR